MSTTNDREYADDLREAIIGDNDDYRDAYLNDATFHAQIEVVVLTARETMDALTKRSKERRAEFQAQLTAMERGHR